MLITLFVDGLLKYCFMVMLFREVKIFPCNKMCRGTKVKRKVII